MTNTTLPAPSRGSPACCTRSASRTTCDAAITLFQRHFDATVGLIALDGAGNAGVSFNSAAMLYAYALGESEISSGARRS